MYVFLVEDIVVVKEVAVVIEGVAILAVVAIEILLLVLLTLYFHVLNKSYNFLLVLEDMEVNHNQAL